MESTVFITRNYFSLLMEVLLSSEEWRDQKREEELNANEKGENE